MNYHGVDRLFTESLRHREDFAHGFDMQREGEQKPLKSERARSRWCLLRQTPLAILQYCSASSSLQPSNDPGRLLGQGLLLTL